MSGVQGSQGNLPAITSVKTLISSQKIDNTNAQIRKVQEAQARFNQKRISNPNNA